MKKLIMCEGPNELSIMKILLNNNMLIFSEDDLLGLTPYHARQIGKSGQVKAELNQYSGIVDVIRIGDKQSDELKIPKEYKGMINSIEKYCTKPELEILLIIAEGLYNKYQKVKSKISPKQFAKDNIIFNGVRYNNSTKFFEEYFGERPQVLYDAIVKYSEVNKGHGKSERYLVELLRGYNLHEEK